MGMLPVDICAVSNVKVYGYHINEEYMKIVYSYVYPVAIAGGELLCRVWFFPLWNIPD
jgi:hypothetical protein